MQKFSSILIFFLCNATIFTKPGEAVVTTTSGDTTNAQPSGSKSTTNITDDNTTSQTSDNKNEETSPLDQQKSKKPEGNHDAFILLRSFLSLIFEMSDYKLPTKYHYDEKENELQLVAGMTHVFKTTLCPELNTRNIVLAALMDNLDITIPGAGNCLFIRNDEKTKCTLEPKAYLQTETKKENEKRVPVLCGIKDKQQLITTAFLNCGTQEKMQDYANEVGNTGQFPPFKLHSYLMYETCYDFKNKKTLWTRHAVLTPALLAHEKYPYRSLDAIDITEFSINTYDTGLDSNSLRKLKESYASTESSKKMLHTLVPKEHMALPYWKKSTSHMTNTAPLLPMLDLLMEAINEGIFKASAYALSEMGKELKIYTKAETGIPKRREVVNKLHLGKVGESVLGAQQSFHSNAWYKFIHDEDDNAGILIILNNKDDDVENKECAGNEMKCSFQTWIDAETTIPEQILTHAYCCHLPAERIRELFSMNELLPIQKKLDLQEMIDLYPSVKEKVVHIGDKHDFEYGAKETANDNADSQSNENID